MAEPEKNLHELYEESLNKPTQAEPERVCEGKPEPPVVEASKGCVLNITGNIIGGSPKTCPDMKALQECIHKGHDMDMLVDSALEEYCSFNLFHCVQVTLKCKRCGYTTKRDCTSKEKRALKVLGKIKH